MTTNFNDNCQDKTEVNSWEQNEPELLEPWMYIRNLPGKNIRGKLADAFQTWLEVPEHNQEAVKNIVDTLHDASLLIDDIEDNSELRRGKPVAHAIYGVPATINCANYVYFIALQKCSKLNNQKAMDVYVKEMLNLHRGQGYDILWRDNSTCPSEEQYTDMVINKTGGLFRLAVGMMQSFSKCQTDFTNLLNKLALYFQIRDDYINLVDTKYMENKSFCEDLSEGKFSFPVIYAIRKHPHDHRLLNILKQRTKNIELKKHAVDYLREVGAFGHTVDKLEILIQAMTEEIQRLGGNPILSTILKALHASVQSS